MRALLAGLPARGAETGAGLSCSRSRSRRQERAPPAPARDSKLNSDRKPSRTQRRAPRPGPGQVRSRRASCDVTSGEEYLADGDATLGGQLLLHLLCRVRVGQMAVEVLAQDLCGLFGEVAPSPPAKRTV